MPIHINEKLRKLLLETSLNYETIIKQTGLSYATVTSAASRLRAQGHEVPKRPRKKYEPLTTPTDPSERRCVICKVTKPISDFYKVTNQNSGSAYTCKPCNTIQTLRMNYRREIRQDRAAFMKKVEDASRKLTMMMEELNREP